MAWTIIWILTITVYQYQASPLTPTSSSLEESTAALNSSAYDYYSYENASYENGSYEYYSDESNASNELVWNSSSKPVTLPTLLDGTTITLQATPVPTAASLENLLTSSIGELDAQQELPVKQIGIPRYFSTTILPLLNTLNASTNVKMEEQSTTETGVVHIAHLTSIPSNTDAPNVGTGVTQAPLLIQTENLELFFPTSFNNRSYLESDQPSFSMQTDIPKMFKTNTVQLQLLNRNHTRQKEMHRSELTAACDDGTQCTVLTSAANDDKSHWMKAGISAGSAIGVVAAIAAYTIHRKKNNRRQVTPQRTRTSTPLDVEQQTTN